eukprot:2711079-Pleurochrysis_carterae.AAC.1
MTGEATKRARTQRRGGWGCDADVCTRGSVATSVGLDANCSVLTATPQRKVTSGTRAAWDKHSSTGSALTKTVSVVPNARSADDVDDEIG